MTDDASGLPAKDTPSTSSVDAVVEGLRDLIRSRDLNAGDALPAERELADQFGVSRNTIRESLRILETYGAIERKPRGAVVAEAGVDVLLKAATFQTALDCETYLDVQSFRHALERGLSDAIIANVTPADIDVLWRINHTILEDISAEKAAMRDFTFHVRLMACSGNETAVKVFTALAAQLQNIMQQGKDWDGRLLTAKAHERILHALEQGSADDLRKAFDDHYDDSLTAMSDLPKREKLNP